MAAPDIEKPKAPGNNAATKQKLKYDHDLKKLLRRGEEWEDTNGLIYEKFYKHCTTSMLTKLKGEGGWSNIADNQDGVTLIKQF